MAVKSNDFLSFNDGTAEIYDVVNSAAAGDTPVEKLVLKAKLRFAENTVGMQRFFEAQQVKVDISRVITTPLVAVASPQDIIVIGDKQYKIAQLQRMFDTRPESMKLTLTDSEEKYEL